MTTTEKLNPNDPMPEGLRSGTVDPVSTTGGSGSAHRPAPGAARRAYADRWRSVPRELGFLLLTLPIATVAFSVTVGLFSAAAGTVVTVVFGVAFIVAALYVSRWFGIVELVRLEWAGRDRITRPEWQDARARLGFVGWLRAVFGNGHYWLYLLHAMVINFVVSLVTWTITVVWLSVALSGITYFLWNETASPEADQFVLARWFAERWQADTTGINFQTIDNVLFAALGVLLVVTLPFVTRAFVWVHDAIARGVLGPFKSDDLQRQVIALNASRGAASSAEGHSLRRLERDIHDGPQQRLVRLQMDLAAADRQLDSDPQKARTLIAEAMQQSKDALEELRALSRGFAPPMLLDRGLIAALESAASRSPLPARVRSEVPDGVLLPQEVERNAYFFASEALANAAKHSGASKVDVSVAMRRELETDATWLEVRVADDGVGGARLLDGHGLAGLEERLRGLGGILFVESPRGGPTVVTAHLPVTY